VAANIDQQSLLVEVLNGIRVVKAYNLEERQKTRFARYSSQIVHHNMKATQARELVNPAIETISMVGLGLVLVLVFHTGTTLPDLVGFLTAVVLCFSPIKKLSGIFVAFARTSVGVERLQSLLAESPSVSEPIAPRNLGQLTQGVEFQSVSFGYRDEPVLTDISFHLRRGQRLGIAGESGSGKSTVINLLLRFYDPTKGSVMMDGIDFRSFRGSDLRQQMAFVGQDVVIFDMTIAENIGCGLPTAGRKAIEQAAKDAYADEFIRELPEGYDTRVGERGYSLSGGQRQRLAIARAFLKNAPILLLDEATAALDSKAESQVQRAIERLEENRTVVCVAHRLSTLENMDEILVLQRGRIVERGSFQALLEMGGEFASMAAKQGLRSGSFLKNET
jgi:subfamily B ATP-binding cassette protein MsbA